MINRLHRDYPGARAGVFTTVGDVDDLVRDLECWAVPVFRPTVFSFSRYDAEEIPGIFREQTGPLTSGTVSAAVRNDMRIGYTVFFKRLRKLDALRLVNLIRVQSGGGTSEIVLRYERELVREVCG